MQEADLLTHVFHSGLISELTSVCIGFFSRFFFFFSREESLRLLLVRKLSNGWTYHALCILLFSPLGFDMASYLYLCCCLVPLNEEALIPLFCRVNLPSPATVGKGWPSQHSEKEVRNRLWADVRDTLGCLPNSHFFPYDFIHPSLNGLGKGLA